MWLNLLNFSNTSSVKFFNFLIDLFSCFKQSLSPLLKAESPRREPAINPNPNVAAPRVAPKAIEPAVRAPAEIQHKIAILIIFPISLSKKPSKLSFSKSKFKPLWNDSIIPDTKSKKLPADANKFFIFMNIGDSAYFALELMSSRVFFNLKANFAFG